jgi:hypothetical protein
VYPNGHIPVPISLFPSELTLTLHSTLPEEPVANTLLLLQKSNQIKQQPSRNALKHFGQWFSSFSKL